MARFCNKVIYSVIMVVVVVVVLFIRVTIPTFIANSTHMQCMIDGPALWAYRVTINTNYVHGGKGTWFSLYTTFLFSYLIKHLHINFAVVLGNSWNSNTSFALSSNTKKCWFER